MREIKNPQNEFYINPASQSSARKDLIPLGLLHRFEPIASCGFCYSFYFAEVCDAPLGKFIEDRADGAAEIG